MQNLQELYAGNGVTLSKRNLSLPAHEPRTTLNTPEQYVADKPLRDAVNVALALGQPLLVTGEPGTGKTQLASSIAHELEVPLLTFNAKTTSTARDLFYRYDTLAHFHDAHFRTDKAPIESYITYEAVGLAILLGMPASTADPFLPEAWKGRGPTRSVVLIDEIDKAPRDLPNDVLNEIEHLEFFVRETGRQFRALPGVRPILVLTSNSERNLPDAFLRRCVFYHIRFPSGEKLKEIVQRRLQPDDRFSPGMVDRAIAQFEQMRRMPLSKRPATAECLAWIQVLEHMQVDPGALKPGQAETLAISYSVLAKSQEDLEKIQHAFSTGS